MKEQNDGKLVFPGNAGMLPYLTHGKSRAINAENRNGEKGKGGMEASPLGKSRKGSPCLKDIQPGEEVVLGAIHGPGVIHHIWVTTDNKTAEGDGFVLRDLVIRIYWDEEKEPSVEVLLGDFFCCGFGKECIINSDLVTVVPSRGMNSYIQMPFKKKALVTLENQHVNAIPAFFYQIDYTLYDYLLENTTYFHAQWRRQALTEIGKDYVIIDGIKGKYHFFFQYNPYYGFWDCMHWGHAVSDDMIHWEYLPLALAPSENYDNHPRGGCFSGSAIEHGGKLFLMFTGTANNGEGFEQTQCIAYSEDGIHFEKYEGNPVLTAPEGIPTDFFRDPKIWKHEDTYYMVCGASRNHKARALLYRSKDMFHWEFFNVLAESRGEWGYMWECPDFYPLGDKYVLMFSPMRVGDRTVVYLVGDFDYQTGKFDYHVNGEIDWGFDYYAPQSFEAPDGRRIIVGWSNAWDWMPFWKDWGPTYQEGWCGFYNIPREVRLMENNTLQFIPVKEMESIRQEVWKQEQMLVGEDRL